MRGKEAVCFMYVGRKKGSHSGPLVFFEITSSGNLLLWFAIYCCVVEADFFTWQ
jgi:hypothetical protein